MAGRDILGESSALAVDGSTERITVDRAWQVVGRPRCSLWDRVLSVLIATFRRIKSRVISMVSGR
jgi:hypothetical protein